jgi:hypothetical protein
VAHRGNVAELAGIREENRESFGVDCGLSLWAPLGFGTESEDLRLEVGDLDRVDDAVREGLAACRPEAEWVESLADAADPPFPERPPVVHLAVDDAGEASLPYAPAAAGLAGTRLGAVPADPVPALLEGWERTYRAWCGRYPSVGELARECGDTGGRKLHDERSVVRKWCNRHDEGRAE